MNDPITVLNLIKRIPMPSDKPAHINPLAEISDFNNNIIITGNDNNTPPHPNKSNTIEGQLANLSIHMLLSDTIVSFKIIQLIPTNLPSIYKIKFLF